jgi:hypothetical protein
MPGSLVMSSPRSVQRMRSWLAYYVPQRLGTAIPPPRASKAKQPPRATRATRPPRGKRNGTAAKGNKGYTAGTNKKANAAANGKKNNTSAEGKKHKKIAPSLVLDFFHVLIFALAPSIYIFALQQIISPVSSFVPPLAVSLSFSTALFFLLIHYRNRGIVFSGDPLVILVLSVIVGQFSLMVLELLCFVTFVAHQIRLKAWTFRPKSALIVLIITIIFCSPFWVGPSSTVGINDAVGCQCNGRFL